MKSLLAFPTFEYILGDWLLLDDIARLNIATAHSGNELKLQADDSAKHAQRKYLLSAFDGAIIHGTSLLLSLDAFEGYAAWLAKRKARVRHLASRALEAKSYRDGSDVLQLVRLTSSYLHSLRLEQLTK